MDNSPYTRYHAQIQRVVVEIYSETLTMVLFMIKVPRYKLDRATGQSFYIINEFDIYVYITDTLL